jgi:hypothetical protein
MGICREAGIYSLFPGNHLQNIYPEAKGELFIE